MHTSARFLQTTSRLAGLLIVAAAATACAGGSDDEADGAAPATTSESTAESATTSTIEPEPTDSSTPTDVEEQPSTTDAPPATTTTTTPPLIAARASISVVITEAAVGDQPTLEWNGVDGAADYRLVVRDGGGAPYWAWSGPETSVFLGGGSSPDGAGARVPAGGDWSVIARDADGNPIATSGWTPFATP